MLVLEGLAAGLETQLLAFFSILVRISMILMLLPGIGDRVIPNSVKVAATIAITFFVYGIAAEPTFFVDRSISFIAGQFVLEGATGLALGLMLRLVIFILSITGALIAQSISLSQYLGVTTNTDAQTIVSNILTMTGTVILLSADYHVEVVTQIARSYDVLNILKDGLPEIDLWIGKFFLAMEIAIALAWPFVVMSFLYYICLGFVNKALPQLLVSFVGVPFVLGMGLLMLAIMMSSLFDGWMAELFAVTEMFWSFGS